MGSLHFVDIIIIASYIACCIAVGLYRAKHISNIREYTIGPGRFHDIVIISTIFATSISSGSTIGTVEKIYVYGLFFAVTRMLSPFFWYIMIHLYAKHIDNFRDCISISDIMYKLYGNTGRWITNVCAVSLAVAAVASQATAMGYIFNYFLGMEYSQGLYLSVIIMVAYSSLGGIRAVAFTDVFQLSVFIIAIPVACAVAYSDLGGYDQIVARLPPDLLELNLNSHNLPFFLSLLFYALMPLAEGAYIQRFLMTSGKDQLIRSLKAVMYLTIPFTIVICLIGFLVRAKIPDIDPNIAFIYFISNYLNVGLKGLLVAGMLAVIMSSADSWINYASVLCAHDIYKKIRPKISAKHELFIARLSAALIGSLSMLLGLSERSVLSLCWIADNVWQPFVFIPLTAGFVGLKTNAKSFFISVVFAIAFTFIGAEIDDGEFATISLAFGIFGSTIGLFGTHYWQKYNKTLNLSINHQTSNGFSRVISSADKVIQNQKEAFKNLAALIRYKVERDGSKPHAFSIFIIINYLIPLLVINISGNIINDSIIYLRIISIVLCLALLFVEYWPSELRSKFYPLYWYFCAFFSIPFIASYTIFITYTSEFWILNATISIVLLFAIFDWMSFIGLMVSGCISGYLVYKLINNSNSGPYISSHDVLLLIYLYGFLALLMFLFVKDKDKVQKKYIENMEVFGGAIAHEVNTPIAVIQMIAMTFVDLASNILKQSKCITSSDGEKNYSITMSELDYNILFNSLPNDLLNTSKEAKKIVDVLLLLLKHRGTEYNTACSMREVVNEVLSEYLAQEDKRRRIKFNQSNDFKFFGTKQYMKQVLHNLLSNSFKYAGDEAKISIWIQGNTLHFNDNGVGILPENMPNLFKPFNKKGIKGNGIGMAFCGILIHHMGGIIECSSEIGKYTEFTITLPAFR